jgi:hypothetical protein
MDSKTEITRGGEKITVTRKEFKTLEFLTENAHFTTPKGRSPVSVAASGGCCLPSPRRGSFPTPKLYREVHPARLRVTVTPSHSRRPSRLLKNYSQSTALYGTRRHARRRSAAESHVQLFVAGSAGAEGSSAARCPGHGGRSAYSTLAAVRHDACPRGTSVDCAGEAVAGTVAADPHLH